MYVKIALQYIKNLIMINQLFSKMNLRQPIELTVAQ